MSPEFIASVLNDKDLQLINTKMKNRIIELGPINAMNDTEVSKLESEFYKLAKLKYPNVDTEDIVDLFV